MRKMEIVPGIFKRQWDISITMGILNGVVISTLNISKTKIGNYLVYSHEQKPFAVYVYNMFFFNSLLSAELHGIRSNSKGFYVPTLATPVQRGRGRR